MPVQSSLSVLPNHHLILVECGVLPAFRMRRGFVTSKTLVARHSCKKSKKIQPWIIVEVVGGGGHGSATGGRGIRMVAARVFVIVCDFSNRSTSGA